MGIEYARILKVLKVPFIAVGRSKNSAKKFEKETGVPAIAGGMTEEIAKNNPDIKSAIVAVNIEELGKVTRNLINLKIKSILVEKPAGLNEQDIRKTAQLAKSSKAKVYVAYNRRFNTSVNKTREYIKNDGGVLSFSFEFTELAHVIATYPVPMTVKQEWFMANSSHVVDLAFFLGGKPKTLSAYTAGAGDLSWYDKGSIFAGAGVSQNGALFSYQANWQSGGRWGVEIMTSKRRLILRPLEKLFVQERGSFEVKEDMADYTIDKNFKAGFYNQVKAFLSGQTKDLPTIQEQAGNMKYYQVMVRGK